MKKYTHSAKKSDNPQKWYVVDAKDLVLGRLASQVAARLRGKHNPLYTPHADMGDWIIVINASKVRLTGKKMEQKIYYRHSGYMGGLKATTAKVVMQTKPEDVIKHAIKGMLPKTKLGSDLLTKVKIYEGSDHPHIAQQPEPLKLAY